MIEVMATRNNTGVVANGPPESPMTRTSNLFSQLPFSPKQEVRADSPFLKHVKFFQPEVRESKSGQMNSRPRKAGTSTPPLKDNGLRITPEPLHPHNLQYGPQEQRAQAIKQAANIRSSAAMIREPPSSLFPQFPMSPASHFIGPKSPHAAEGLFEPQSNGRVHALQEILVSPPAG